MRRFIILAFAFWSLVGIGLLSSCLWVARQGQMPVLNADFPVCVRVNPGPLLKPHRQNNGAARVSEIS